VIYYDSILRVIFRDLLCGVIIDEDFRVIFYDTISLLILYNSVALNHFLVLPGCHILLILGWKFVCGPGTMELKY
jgi:hypothetical protein